MKLLSGRLYSRSVGRPERRSGLRAVIALDDDEVRLDRIASSTDGWSGADLTHLCDSAAELALERSLRAGKISLLEFNVVRRDLVDARLGYLDALADLVEARSTLELALGGSLE